MDSLMMPNPTAQAELIASSTATPESPRHGRLCRGARHRHRGRRPHRSPGCARRSPPWTAGPTPKRSSPGACSVRSSPTWSHQAAAGLTGVRQRRFSPCGTRWFRHASLHRARPLLDLDGGPFRWLTGSPRGPRTTDPDVPASALSDWAAPTRTSSWRTSQTRPAAVPAAARSAFVVPLSAGRRSGCARRSRRCTPPSPGRRTCPKWPTSPTPSPWAGTRWRAAPRSPSLRPRNWSRSCGAPSTAKRCPAHSARNASDDRAHRPALRQESVRRLLLSAGNSCPRRQSRSWFRNPRAPDGRHHERL